MCRRSGTAGTSRCRSGPAHDRRRPPVYRTVKRWCDQTTAIGPSTSTSPGSTPAGRPRIPRRSFAINPISVCRSTAAKSPLAVVHQVQRHHSRKSGWSAVSSFVASAPRQRRRSSVCTVASTSALSSRFHAIAAVGSMDDSTPATTSREMTAAGHDCRLPVPDQRWALFCRATRPTRRQEPLRDVSKGSSNVAIWPRLASRAPGTKRCGQRRSFCHRAASAATSRMTRAHDDASGGVSPGDPARDRTPVPHARAKAGDRARRSGLRPPAGRAYGASSRHWQHETRVSAGAHRQRPERGRHGRAGFERRLLPKGEMHQRFERGADAAILSRRRRRIDRCRDSCVPLPARSPWPCARPARRVVSCAGDHAPSPLRHRRPAPAPAAPARRRLSRPTAATCRSVMVRDGEERRACRHVRCGCEAKVAGTRGCAAGERDHHARAADAAACACTPRFARGDRRRGMSRCVVRAGNERSGIRGASSSRSSSSTGTDAHQRAMRFDERIPGPAAPRAPRRARPVRATRQPATSAMRVVCTSAAFGFEEALPGARQHRERRLDGWQVAYARPARRP